MQGYASDDSSSCQFGHGYRCIGLLQELQFLGQKTWNVSPEFAFLRLHFGFLCLDATVKIYMHSY